MDRAGELGWSTTQIELVAEDLGQSGKFSENRDGFQRLAAAVSLGQVGAVFMLEASRLARSSADWHRLLEIACLTRTLIVDESTVYDPRDPNDRLVLGMKGTMADFELVWLRQRMDGGRWHLARKGELRVHTPLGYVYEGNRLVFDPDEEVRRAVALFFERFARAAYEDFLRQLVQSVLERRPLPKDRKARVEIDFERMAGDGRDRALIHRLWAEQEAARVVGAGNAERPAEVRRALGIVPEELQHGRAPKFDMEQVKLACLMRNYRCSGASTGGICTNRTPLREDALIDAAFAELDRLAHLPALQAQLREKVARRIKDIKSDAGRSLADLKREVSRVDRKVERFLAFIEATKVNDPSLDVVRGSLTEAVTRQRDLKAKLAALQEHRPETRAPTVEELVNLAQDVHARLKEDPIAGREMLRNLLGDGMMKMTPNDDGSYEVESSLIWERLTWKTRKPRGGSRPSGAPEVVGNDGCAGSQLDFPARQIQGVAEVWVPFDEVIAEGWA